MRELVYYVAVSLDGRIAAPSGDFSAFSAEGDHMDVVMTDFRDTLPAPALQELGLTPDRSRFDTVVMGWGTYAAGLPFGVDDPYPHLRQVVVSRSRRSLPGGIEVTDDPVARVRALKRETSHSDVWLCGGGRLAGTLDEEIDRLILKVNPVLLGEGRPLLDGTYAARGFTLVASTAYRSGVVISEYRR